MPMMAKNDVWIGSDAIITGGVPAKLIKIIEPQSV